MIKECKRQLSLSSGELWSGLIIAAGTTLLITAITAIVTLKAPGAQIPRVASICVYFAVILRCVILLASHIGVRFNFAIKMGAVRRQYIAATFIINWASCFALLCFGIVWDYLEQALYLSLGAAETIGFTLPVPAALMISLAATVVGGWLGALVFCYGRKGFWVAWAIWMIAVLGGSRLPTALSEENPGPVSLAIQAVAAFLGRLHLWGLLLIVLALLSALAVHALFLLRRAPAYD